MKKTNRFTFGVITTQIADIEQSQILKAIIEKAKSLNINIVVISNIYNPELPDSKLNCENDIYDIILSEIFDAFILISESFVNEELRKKIKNNLILRSNTPTIAIGTPLPEFILKNVKYINTDDEADIYEITNHLIDVHGFTDIDFLTGHKKIKASTVRINGYRRALEDHGLEFDQEKVHYGDFWMPSGEALAQKYINGDLPFPQAVVCANDYMAYGMLDYFSANDVDIPEKITIIGYEYIRERHFHVPVLTSYQRNRKSIGYSAVELLIGRIESGEYSEFKSPVGNIITGNSCGCGISTKQFNLELESARLKQIYNFLNLFSQFEHSLTECRNLKEYISTCQNYKYLIRNVDEISFCLRDNWNYTQAGENEMTYYGICPEREPFHFHKDNISNLFGENNAAYYFQPIFFSNRTLGYFILRYNTPDTPDYIFRNWLKSASNGLELLRIKNDVQYLTLCQNLSQTHDTLTGLYNINGIKKYYYTVPLTSDIQNTNDMYCVTLRIGLFDTFAEIDSKSKIDSILDISKWIKKLCISDGCVGRISDDTFVCLVKMKNGSAQLIRELSEAIVTQCHQYIKNYGMNSFVICCFPHQKNISFDEQLKKCTAELEKQQQSIYQQRMIPHFRKLLRIRNYIYLNPSENFNFENNQNLCEYSAGYLRVVYKKCFGISFHQDFIVSRIRLAVFLLYTSDCKLNDISRSCGYTDEKYFYRQFRKITGFTPYRYRELFE